MHRAARTRARVKDLDQIETDLRPQNRNRLEKQPIDEDKPGLGQHVSFGHLKDVERGVLI